MLYSGYAESAGNPFGFEQAYRDAPPRLSPFRPRTRIFGCIFAQANTRPPLATSRTSSTSSTLFSIRRTRPKQETWINGYTFENWRRLSGESIDPHSFPLRDSHLTRRRYGETPQTDRLGAGRRAPRRPQHAAAAASAGRFSARDGLPGSFAALRRYGHARPVAGEGMGWTEIPFGDGLKADLFYPADHKSGKWPVVIWLHPYSYQNGWSVASPWSSKGSDYRLDQRPSFPSLVTPRIRGARVRPDRIRATRARRPRILRAISQVVADGQDGVRYPRRHRLADAARHD